MKKVLLLVAVLGFVASANATFEVWFTDPATNPAGLTNPAYMFQPTGGVHNDYDYYDLDGNPQQGPYAVTTFPAAWSVPTVGVGEPLYMWFHFNSETTGIKVQGLHLDMKATTGVEPWRNCATNTGARIQDICYYVMDNNGTPELPAIHQWLRWQGSQIAPQFCDFRNDDQVLAAVTAGGIVNNQAAAAWNLYKGGAATGALNRTALLGAVKFDTPGEYYFVLGSERISIADQPQYPINFVSGHVIVTPEPASLLLLGLASLVLRRR